MIQRAGGTQTAGARCHTATEPRGIHREGPNGAMRFNLTAQKGARCEVGCHPAQTPVQLPLPELPVAAMA